MITLKTSGKELDTISAAHPLLYKITLKSPNPCETSERMNFNVIDKKNN
jgi:hypothetical protein